MTHSSTPLLSTQEVARVAAGLTEAQRRAVLSGVAVGPGMWPLRNVLAVKGLAQSMPFRLSALGLAVRNHLLQTKDAS